MSLEQVCVPLFSLNTRENGADYFHSGRVLTEESHPTLYAARVRGPESYQVELELDGQSLIAACSCAHARGGNLCEHMWAAILDADQRRVLQPKSTTTPLQIVNESEDYYGPDDSFFADENADAEAPEIWEDRSGQERGRLSDPLGAVFNLLRLTGKMRPGPARKPNQPTWKQLLIADCSSAGHHLQTQTLREREIRYQTSFYDCSCSADLQLLVELRERKLNGQWGAWKNGNLDLPDLERLTDPLDRKILGLLAGVRPVYDYGGRTADYRLRGAALAQLLPDLCATGRFYMKSDGRLQPAVLRYDDGPPWTVTVEMAPGARGKYRVTARLQRGQESRELAAARGWLSGGWIFFGDTVARYDNGMDPRFLGCFHHYPEIGVPEAEARECVETLYTQTRAERLIIPPHLRLEEIAVRPKPELRVKKARAYYQDNTLVAELGFDYNGQKISSSEGQACLFLREAGQAVRRDLAAELKCRQTLDALGFKPATYYIATDGYNLQIAVQRFPAAVAALIREGWHVEADGKLYRSPTSFAFTVSSGVDWFELRGAARFEQMNVELPTLLRALADGQRMITLGDGTMGILPEDWLAKIGMFKGVGREQGDHIRFQRTQAAVLDAMLAESETAFDEQFERLRRELRTFETVAPCDAGAGFQGQLRPYQRDGMGWFEFLRRFGFGGCLADDMGLGKTVQVLAMLDARREERLRTGAAETGPTLVVTPRSLIFNWMEEARRFTPGLKILDHTGQQRPEDAAHFGEYDMVLTTYGTLRRDIFQLKDVAYDYVILDESQAIKNHQALTTKAVRLLRSRHRLALSGTPIENHLGELWSLFEFLNPGMLGAVAAFKRAGVLRDPDAETRVWLARALRPFILRRTKSQVARDLPEKIEETVYCELGAEQRRLYDELRDHYRAVLMKKVARDGLNKSKIQVLEALLRLRQAACHPGLINSEHLKLKSAKLDALMAQATEVTEEGHKALIFSQFTSLLAIVREHLDKAEIPYAYLDGQTADRQACVKRFQSDPECKLFLISLKAGGLGLNLTAAEYIFLLDPWWNPAVEAQAIDRAHRIGQTQKVFAYRLIARDTVEEKVLELQNSKRALADAIITADNSLIGGLTGADLELLLS